MSGPKQAATFEAFERTTNKGSVTYTDFEVADESGVFVPNLGTFTLSLTNVVDGVNQYPGPFTHAVTIDSYERSRLPRPRSWVTAPTTPTRRGRRPSLAP